jgi:hypothetical protein
VTVDEGAIVRCVCPVSRDGAEASVTWELLTESGHKGFGGDAELRPAPVALPSAQARLSADTASLEFAAPPAGSYRIFVYVHGTEGTVATGNFPFRVK